MPKQTNVADEILAYLSRQPESRDTLAGILNWWVRADKGTHGVQQVREALKALLDTGEVIETKGEKEETTVYRVKKARRSP